MPKWEHTVQDGYELWSVILEMDKIQWHSIWSTCSLLCSVFHSFLLFPPLHQLFFYPSQMLMQPEGALKLKWCENRIAVANELCLLVPSGPNEPFEHASPPVRRPCSGPQSLRRSPPFSRQLECSQRSADQAEADWDGVYSFIQYIHSYIRTYKRAYDKFKGLQSPQHKCIVQSNKL